MNLRRSGLVSVREGSLGEFLAVYVVSVRPVLLILWVCVLTRRARGSESAARTITVLHVFAATRSAVEQLGRGLTAGRLPRVLLSARARAFALVLVSVVVGSRARRRCERCALRQAVVLVAVVATALTVVLVLMRLAHCLNLKKSEISIFKSALFSIKLILIIILRHIHLFSWFDLFEFLWLPSSDVNEVLWVRSCLMMISSGGCSELWIFKILVPEMPETTAAFESLPTRILLPAWICCWRSMSWGHFS
jgi:hypothetical protein